MPPRLSAQDFDQELLILFDAYVHGQLDRRGFLAQAQKFAKAGITAAGLLAALSPDFAAGQQVTPNDPRLKTERLSLASPAGHGSITGYLARPAGAGTAKLPAVLVIHENRGLNPHIEDITRRLALDGFMAFAPDALTPLGGYPGDEEKAVAAFATLDRAKTLEDFVTAARWLQARSDGNGKLGAVGFCYGGGIVHLLATRLPELNAGVPFYGNVPAPAEAAKVKAPLLVQQAAVDERINAAWPAYEAALKAAGASYTVYRYPGTQHGFNNDTTPRYDAAAAKLAWERTIAFFKTHLQAPASVATAQDSPVVRLRGTLQAVGPDSLMLKTRGGEVITLALPAKLVVMEVYPIALADIHAGSFVGVGGQPQADGSQRAVAVTVFPESARGSGEGHRPFDLAPDSTMTNATVADLATAPQGRKLQLKYQGGEQTIIVPPGTPIVSFKPADRSLLVSGASVSLSAQALDGKPTALRINAGRDGFALPY
ncbi:Dienelactone hydrolase [Polaromonas sp. OV174]|uniref:dienelactone hydrolase family protein n=1 Tax=Polaromonas sp. OV174 TaxID=1855300 RepID=UPI0008E29C4B|nr:Dienelactone hydrolase [Polaromonas sp. OV174]